MIIIICGLPGTGKTTLANELAPLLNSVVLSSDKIRKKLFPRPTYSRRERRLVYDVMILIAKHLHQAGTRCILDATFNREDSRMEVKETLDLSDKDFYIVECFCPEEVVISRLGSRKNDYSDATITIYKKMKKIYEPVRTKHITVDTSFPSKDTARLILEDLQQKGML